MPDQELADLAESGKLKDPAVLEAQIDRMLADKRAYSLADSFAEQWLQVGRMEEHSPDPEIFEGFDDQLKQDMLRETRLFFIDLMREDKSVIDLLDGEYTFVNSRLARHYGLNPVQGDTFRKVSLKGTPRAGIMTHGSILTVTSDPSRTSPVKRGKWVLEQILGTPPPPPPPGTPVIENQDETGKDLTFREKMVLHRQKPECISCHKLMDPLGFGMENFDGVGRWREIDTDGKKIDSAGELPSGEKFSGPEDLRKILVKRKSEFVRSLTTQLMTYALGRGLRADDLVFVHDSATRAEKNGYKFSEVVKGIVLSDAFRKKAKQVETQ
jgi:hypothetical protein